MEGKKMRKNNKKNNLIVTFCFVAFSFITLGGMDKSAQNNTNATATQPSQSAAITSAVQPTNSRPSSLAIAASSATSLYEKQIDELVITKEENEDLDRVAVSNAQVNVLNMFLATLEKRYSELTNDLSFKQLKAVANSICQSIKIRFLSFFRSKGISPRQLLQKNTLSLLEPKLNPNGYGMLKGMENIHQELNGNVILNGAAVIITIDIQLQRLIDAVQAHDIVQVKKLLDAGVNPNQFDQFDFSPLFYAVLFDFDDIAELLVKKDPKTIDAPNKYGIKAAQFIHHFYSPNPMELLFKSFEAQSVPEKQSALSALSSTATATQKTTAQTLKKPTINAEGKAIEEFALNKEENEDLDRFCLALSNGATELERIKIGIGKAQAINAKNPELNLIKHLLLDAIDHIFIRIISFFKNKGIKPRDLIKKNNILALEKKLSDNGKRILKQIKNLAKTEHGNRILDIEVEDINLPLQRLFDAVQANDLQQATKLLESIDPNQGNRFMFSPIFYAVLFDLTDMVALIAKKNPLTLNAANREGIVPLLLTDNLKSPRPTADLMIKMGATLNAENNRVPPLTIAIEEAGQIGTKVVEALISRNVDINYTFLNKTPYDLALEKESKETNKKAKHNYFVVQALLLQQKKKQSAKESAATVKKAELPVQTRGISNQKLAQQLLANKPKNSAAFQFDIECDKSESTHSHFVSDIIQNQSSKHKVSDQEKEELEKKRKAKQLKKAARLEEEKREKERKDKEAIEQAELLEKEKREKESDRKRIKKEKKLNEIKRKREEAKILFEERKRMLEKQISTETQNIANYFFKKRQQKQINRAKSQNKNGRKIAALFYKEREKEKIEKENKERNAKEAEQKRIIEIIYKQLAAAEVGSNNVITASVIDDSQRHPLLRKAANIMRYYQAHTTGTYIDETGDKVCLPNSQMDAYRISNGQIYAAAAAQKGILQWWQEHYQEQRKGYLYNSLPFIQNGYPQNLKPANVVSCHACRHLKVINTVALEKKLREGLAKMNSSANKLTPKICT